MAAPGENLTENRTNRRFKKGAESVEETARTRTTREYKATVGATVNWADGDVMVR